MEASSVISLMREQDPFIKGHINASIIPLHTVDATILTRPFPIIPALPRIDFCWMPIRYALYEPYVQSVTCYWVYILGFNHNSTKEGTGIHFGGFKTAQTGGTDICLVDSKYNTDVNNGSKLFNMNHWGSSSSPYNTNYGGWAACDIRYDILGSTDKAPTPYGSTKTTSATGQDPSAACATNPVANTLMAALPADLRAVMQPMTKYTDNKGNSSNVAANVTKTIDYLPLLSEFEIFGARSYANQYEKDYQAQYAYYSAGNSKVKYRHSSTGSTAAWWERSPHYNYGYYFCRVNTDGNADFYSSDRSYGLAPAFKI